jgi:hypothetical protein
MQKLFLVAMIVTLGTTIGITRAVDAEVFATLHGADLGQGEGGGGPLYDDGTAAGNFAISVANGALIFTVYLESWEFADTEHIVICGPLTVVKNDLGFQLPSYACTTPVPISGFPVNSDLDGDGRVDHKEWVRLVDE